MKKLLEVHGITKRFGGIVAVDNISFYVKENEILGIIGPNGAGKTTTFNIIMNEVHQDSGSILFNGNDISNYPTYKRVEAGITRTYQIPKLFKEMTVYDNIRISMLPNSIKSTLLEAESYDSEIRRVAMETGLLEYLSKYPDELPLGILRKVELAMALVKNPRIILIDEVFSGLAATEIRHVAKLIAQKREERMTFVIIDHNLRALSTLVDRFIVMNFGRKIAEGSYEEILRDENVKKAYLGG